MITRIKASPEAIDSASAFDRPCVRLSFNGLPPYMGLMSDAATMPFRKMNGLGNDFVILDARQRPAKLEADEIRRIGDRTKGPGCDQVIVLEPSGKTDVF